MYFQTDHVFRLHLDKAYALLKTDLIRVISICSKQAPKNDEALCAITHQPLKGKEQIAIQTEKWFTDSSLQVELTSQERYDQSRDYLDVYEIIKRLEAKMGRCSEEERKAELKRLMNEARKPIGVKVVTWVPVSTSAMLERLEKDNFEHPLMPDRVLHVKEFKMCKNN
ncbi:hypothetical protein D5018_07240 [Parashewanella curva]|uniref:Uncharacterized protein n=1 Tax=Parashewanella curva TaxID=2338552 RepID=A0A3L8Q147_9GAMM|nr:hypothetical protein [Parashewanella curva]RLV60443.1 hypothetical protein D5018_07240 [Parashewanella curva]